MLDRDIREHRDEILELWIETVVNDYPEETAKFLRSRADRFANPVGAGIRESLPELLDGVLLGADPEELSSALDLVLRVRAVQDLPPSRAVGFVLDLKNHVRKVIGAPDDSSALVEIDRRIERLGLCAFDVYMRCREQMWQIRAREIRNQSVGILERVAEWRAQREASPENTNGPSAHRGAGEAERKEGSDAWER
ncbi:MAG: RsbRD N-terminal domain-containing protein [Acidobacteriota bacterium]